MAANRPWLVIAGAAIFQASSPSSWTTRLTYAEQGMSPAMPALRRASRATSMPQATRFALAPSIRSILSACRAAIEMTRGPVAATPTGTLGKSRNH